MCRELKAPQRPGTAAFWRMTKPTPLQANNTRRDPQNKKAHNTFSDAAGLIFIALSRCCRLGSLRT